MMYQKPGVAPKQMRFFVTLIVVALILAVFAPSVPAEEKADEESGWEFQVAPYMWFLSAEGDVTVKGQKSDVDISFDEIWDELNIAGMVAYDARKGNLGFWGNTIYANLGNSTKVEGIRIDPSVNLLWQGLGGFYRLGTWNLTDAPGKKAATVTADTYFGARYTYLGIKLDIDGFPNKDRDKHWVEPILGVRTYWDLPKRWTFMLAGDIGGVAFGSDFAWQTFGLIGYRFALFSKENNARVLAGYRALSQDYTNGSGDDKFEWDVTLHGPILGLVIRF